MSELDCQRRVSFDSMQLELYVFRSDLSRIFLCFLITLHRRQTKRTDQELPPAQSESQVFAQTITCASTSFASLAHQRKLVHLDQSLRLLVLARAGVALVRWMGGIHEVGKRRKLQYAVCKSFCPSHQRGVSRKQLKWDGHHRCEAIWILT